MNNNLLYLQQKIAACNHFATAGLFSLILLAVDLIFFVNAQQQRLPLRRWLSFPPSLYKQPQWTWSGYYEKRWTAGSRRWWEAREANESCEQLQDQTMPKLCRQRMPVGLWQSWAAQARRIFRSPRSSGSHAVCDDRVSAVLQKCLNINFSILVIVHFFGSMKAW